MVPCPWIVLSLFTRVLLLPLISELALLRMTVPPPVRLTVEASTRIFPLPPLPPTRTVPLLVRSPVRELLVPASTE